MKYLLLLTCIFYLKKGISQDQSPGTSNWGTFLGIPKGIATNNMIDPAWLLINREAGAELGLYNGIKGTAFYNEDWRKGYILFANGQVAADIPIPFNVFSNQIFFLLNNKTLVLAPSVPVTKFAMQQKEDTAKLIVFGSGYPPVDKNNGLSFYNILVQGDISFLKHYDKGLMEAMNSLGAPEKKFIDAESWYFFIKDENKMIPFKKNKSSLLNALPQHAEKIKMIMEDKNLKLKNESDFVRLIGELN